MTDDEREHVAAATESESALEPAKVAVSVELSEKAAGEERDAWLRDHDLLDSAAPEDER